MSQARRGGRDEGYILVAVLIWTGALAVLLSTFVVASHLCLTMAHRNLLDAKCAAVTRGISTSILSALRDNHPALHNTDFAYQSVQISVRSEVQSGTTTVKVEGKLDDVCDTISFTYDTIGRRLLTWQDNGPGIAE